MKKVTKAVFPVAGLGTRFLPATKATPKEMLPIIDKPLIQYAVEEAVSAGIKELIFITSSTKRAIEDHFDRNWELENHLEKTQKQALLDIVQSVLPADVHCAYVRQTEQLGLGHAVLCAAPLIGDESFAVLLADDLIDESGSACLSNMISLFEKTNNSVVAVQTIDPKDTHKYGIVELLNNDVKQALKNIIEKPATKDAPSNLGVVGRYILTPKIFDYLKKGVRGVGGEIQLTDAIAKLIQDESVYAYPLKGTRYDCGSKLGYLEATVQYGLQHEELRDDFLKFLKSLKH
jgi:UTP--glucose-1-phosphate uridylyltransferase